MSEMEVSIGDNEFCKGSFPCPKNIEIKLSKRKKIQPSRPHLSGKNLAYVYAAILSTSSKFRRLSSMAENSIS